jgi:hypothetical protein
MLLYTAELKVVLKVVVQVQPLELHISEHQQE